MLITSHYYSFRKLYTYLIGYKVYIHIPDWLVNSFVTINVLERFLMFLIF